MKNIIGIKTVKTTKKQQALKEGCLLYLYISFMIVLHLSN